MNRCMLPSEHHTEEPRRDKYDDAHRSARPDSIFKHEYILNVIPMVNRNGRASISPAIISSAELLGPSLVQLTVLTGQLQCPLLADM